MAGNGVQDNVVVLSNQISGVLTPCVCGPQATCPMGNRIMCSECAKPHRLDCQRDNNFSTFLCTWCGVYVLNREKEIKAHMISCSHGPFPFTLVDSDMCGCECVHRCDEAIGLMDTYFVQYVAERQELKHPAYPDPFSCDTWVKSDPWEVEYAQETFDVPNMEDRPLSSEMVRWLITQQGPPPDATPMVVYTPVGEEPERVLHFAHPFEQ